VGLVALVVGVAALVWFCRPREEEPVYKGKPLSYWLIREHLKTSEGDIGPREAILAIGTNALPFVVKWMQYEPIPWESRLMEKAPVVEVFYKRRLDLAVAAPDDLRVLGATGSNAIPALRALLQATNSYSAHNAEYCLELIGGPAVPVLMDVVTNHAAYPAVGEWSLMGTMFILGTNSELMIPGLLSCLENGDGDAAMGAAGLLGEIGKQPKRVVPALVRSVESTNRNVRYCAIRSLAAFAGDAREGVPALVKRLEDPDNDMRANVYNALRRIAPEVLGEKVGR